MYTTICKVPNRVHAHFFYSKSAIFANCGKSNLDFIKTRSLANPTPPLEFLPPLPLPWLSPLQGLPLLILPRLGGWEPLQPWETLPVVARPPARLLNCTGTPSSHYPPHFTIPGTSPGIASHLANLPTSSDGRDHPGFVLVGWRAGRQPPVLGLSSPFSFPISMYGVILIPRYQFFSTRVILDPPESPNIHRLHPRSPLRPKCLKYYSKKAPSPRITLPNMHPSISA